MIDIELANKVVELLKSAHQADPDAISALINFRVKCNSEMTEHPTIQCSKDLGVGMLGILNGLCGVDDRNLGAVAAVVDEKTGHVINFVVIRRAVCG